MTVTSNELGQQNIFAKEPPIVMTDHPYGVPHNERAEKLDGRLLLCLVLSLLLVPTLLLVKLFLEFGDLNVVASS